MAEQTNSSKGDKEAWKPPSWMHKANVSDTSFLQPKKLNHGQLLEKEQKRAKKNKDQGNVPQHSVLALIQIQEFEDLFDELYECENSKLRLIQSTSKEIDTLRQRIIFLSNQSIESSATKKSSYLGGILSSLLSSFGGGSKRQNEEIFEPVIRAKFSNTDAMEERIKQIKRTKFELIRQTSEELHRLKMIIRYLEQINAMNKSNDGRYGSSDHSKRDILLELLAAIAITGAVLSL